MQPLILLAASPMILRMTSISENILVLRPKAGAHTSAAGLQIEVRPPGIRKLLSGRYEYRIV